MNPVILPLFRRAILDLMFDIGGEQNHVVLAMHLAAVGHRLAETEVRDVLKWLAERNLVKTEELGPYTVARLIANGRDVAAGRLECEGVSKFKTGE